VTSKAHKAKDFKYTSKKNDMHVYVTGPRFSSCREEGHISADVLCSSFDLIEVEHC